MPFKPILLFFAFVLTLGAVVKGQTRRATSSPKLFDVTRDTIHVLIEGRLKEALLINDKYYAFYEVWNQKSDRYNKKFYIISKDGRTKREIALSDGINEEDYYNQRYWQGRMVVSTESYKDSYYLDERGGEFIKSPEMIDVPIFDGEDYQVTSRCSGEFGSKIYFKNKQTKTTDSIFSGCPVVVNKLGTSYFINTEDHHMILFEQILKIKDPKKAKLRKTSGQSIFTIEEIMPTFRIVASFISDGSLYYIYNTVHYERNDGEKVAITTDSVRIGTITNGKFKPAYQFKEHFDMEFQQQLSPDREQFIFHTDGGIAGIPPYMEAQYGLIEISGNQIKMHYFMSKR